MKYVFMSITLAMIALCPYMWFTSLPHGLPHRPPQQSWDQENLHRLGNQQNCPAVFDAPNGNLRQCL